MWPIKRRRIRTGEISDEEVARDIRQIPTHFSGNVKCCCKCCPQYGSFPATVYLHYDSQINGGTFTCNANCVYQALPNPIPLAGGGATPSWLSACLILATDSVSGIGVGMILTFSCAGTPPCTGLNTGNCTRKASMLWFLTDDRHGAPTPDACGIVRCSPLSWRPECTIASPTTSVFFFAQNLSDICSNVTTFVPPCCVQLTNAHIETT